LNLGLKPFRGVLKSEMPALFPIRTSPELKHRYYGTGISAIISGLYKYNVSNSSSNFTAIFSSIRHHLSNLDEFFLAHTAL